MRKKAWTISVFTGVMAAFGTFLRWLQLQNIFDENELVIRNSGYSLAVLICCAVTLAVLIVLALTLRNKRFDGEDFAIPRGNSIGFLLLISLASVLIVVGSAIMLPTDAKQAGIFGMLSAALLILGIVGYALVMFLPRGRISRPLLCTVATIPAAAMCLWLVSEYRQVSSNPQLWEYAPRLVAIALCAVGFYYLAGFPFGQRHPLRCVVFSCSAAFMCAVTAADGDSVAKAIVFVGIALLFVTSSWVIVSRFSNDK